MIALPQRLGYPGNRGLDRQVLVPRRWYDFYVYGMCLEWR